MEYLPHIVYSHLVDLLSRRDVLALRLSCKRFYEFTEFFGMGLRELTVVSDRTPVQYLALLVEKNPVRLVTFVNCKRVSDYTMVFTDGGVRHDQFEISIPGSAGFQTPALTMSKGYHDVIRPAKLYALLGKCQKEGTFAANTPHDLWSGVAGQSKCLMKPQEVRLENCYVAGSHVWPPMVPFADSNVCRGVANRYLCLSAWSAAAM